MIVASIPHKFVTYKRQLLRQNNITNNATLMVWGLLHWRVVQDLLNDAKNGCESGTTCSIWRVIADAQASAKLVGMPSGFLEQ